MKITVPARNYKVVKSNILNAINIAKEVAESIKDNIKKDRKKVEDMIYRNLEMKEKVRMYRILADGLENLDSRIKSFENFEKNADSLKLKSEYALRLMRLL